MTGVGAAGAITIQDRVVEKVAARAASELPDAGAAAPRVLGRTMSAASVLGVRSSDLAALPKTSVRVDGAFAVIDLELSVRWPCSIPDVTRTVRNHVRQRVEELTELNVAEVNIHVADLVRDLPRQSRVQ
jgi:uncharacterized alkaline shock family protein YloU